MFKAHPPELRVVVGVLVSYSVALVVVEMLGLESVVLVVVGML